MNNGINYFPLNVHLDDKFELIEAEFGLKGFAIVVKLFQRYTDSKATIVNGQRTLHYCSERM